MKWNEIGNGAAFDFATEATAVVSSSSSLGSVMAYSLVTLGVAATAYAAVATFPLWVPFVVKKRRRSSYDLPKRKYDMDVNVNDDDDIFDPAISSDELHLSSYLYGGGGAYRPARKDRRNKTRK